ncbi:hypothetical protein CHA01nite_23890 [Chryseobacterium hagamense]|uniref:Uncharacterized protein n=1 Tax=Chryseobacterium hagamense TaxID=395935 RepID=A0A511YN76_9FLAO|nr:hypothetical protein CHA01nite_23890 [Chryseobacterium hagamense]
MLFVIGYWLLVIGYWLLVIGYWLLVIGYWLFDNKQSSILFRDFLLTVFTVSRLIFSTQKII